MKIACIGGGPAGLYFAILMKKAFPDTEITIYEQNRPDDTFGWGVVFSNETLDNIRTADPETYEEVRSNFAYWSDIETWFGGTCTVSTGHGFCGLARVKLLQILHARARSLGVTLHFETTVDDPGSLADADLVVASDGVNSRVREHYAEHFRPTLDWRKCKFAWFGTDKPLRAFTFIFRENEHGLFQVHAYPFQANRGTWIVECREEVWRAAGLDEASEAESVAYCQELFADHLEGYRLLTNRSIWRTFPTVKNETWWHENIVLLGDAAHTAHFSIGSGTKLAMEDAIALAESFVQRGRGDIAGVLAAYEDARYVEVLKTQKAAQTSLEWFENSARYRTQSPLRFTFNLMTRSKRITYDNLLERDPELVAKVDEQFQREERPKKRPKGPAPAPIFTPLRLRGMELKNRIVVSPMCQYSAVDGRVRDWHLVHLGSRAVGGAGLVMTEMTDVSADGRITEGCAGLYEDEHVVAWRRIVDFVQEHTTARIGIQLAHAGRKGSCEHPWEGPDIPLKKGWRTLAPSPVPFEPHWPVPTEMQRPDMDRVMADFVRSARMAEECGFDLIELHMAHGYLLSSFLSPLSNVRTDEFGGSLENRARFPLEVFRAVREVWPERKPLSVRISATDWLGDEGFTPEEAVAFSRMLKEEGCDLVDVSSAGNVPESEPVYGRMYQVPFAEKIRYETGMPVMAVGAILGADHANTILAAGRADLCALARPHLRDPYFTLRASIDYGYDEQDWPDQYLPARISRS